MTIGKKIIGGYAAILVMLVIVVVGAFYSLNTIQDGYNEYIDVRERQIHDADKLALTLAEETSHVRGWFLSPTVQSLLDDLQEEYQQFESIVVKMQERTLTEVGLGMLNDIANLHEEYKEGQENVIAMAQQGQPEEALALGIKETRPIGDKLTKRIEEFRARQVKLAGERRAEVMAMENSLSTVMIVISIIAIVSGLAIAFLLTRTITRQLRKSVAMVSSSSAQILAITTQVAYGSEETATATSETTTTAEEVRQTAQVSSQKAKYVSENVQKTAQVSQSGRKSLEESIEVMNRIRQQMESIAESIVEFSEQSKSIGEIIATVNNLAEQSNLLAVNAAIEAAKAGEQGKGFVVVAQEVKTLAEQSKQATAQVRTILNDIQKATNVTVMATEQGSKAVESGVKQSVEAGESIRMLGDSITEAAQAAVQIAASSQQQMVGMNQITSAMENIKQSTAENLSGIKQVEQAAQNLNEAARQLRSMIESKKAK